MLMVVDTSLLPLRFFIPSFLKNLYLPCFFWTRKKFRTVRESLLHDYHFTEGIEDIKTVLEGLYK